MGKKFTITEQERRQIRGLYENDNPVAMESDPLVQQSSEVVQELSPEEQELLKSFIESNPDQFKEIVKQEVAQEKDEKEMEGGESEMMEDDEIGMNDQEFQVRRIIHKIVNYVSVGSALSIVPAAMFISGGVALGLGVTALVGTTMKDAAFWKRGGKYTDHHYKAQEKSDMMDMKENKKPKKIKITESQLMRLVKKTVNEEEDNIVPCSQLGIKSDGFCDKTTKKVLTSVPCTKLGVKSPGMCDTKTKKPV
jgi:hypothetical protein